MTKSKIFFYFCLSFISGIFLNSVIAQLGFLAPHLFIGAGLILGIILISVLWRYKKLVVIGFCLIFLILGAWRYQIAELQFTRSEFRQYNDLEKDVTLIGTVVKEPDIREKSIKLTIEVSQIQDETRPRPIDGKVLVTTNRYPEYQYGDKLKIKGKLKIPPVFEDFNYKDYLKKEGIYSLIYLPKIELLERKKGRGLTSTMYATSAIYAKVLLFKNKLRKSIYQNLSPPQSSILGAMILGDKSRIPEDLKEKLNIAGVRHITAVSGMHVAILTTILMSLLLGLGFWRGQAFYLSIILISLFIIMTGLQPSGIRAGIMGGLFLLGQKIGRKSISSKTIVMAGALMLAVNPLLLLDDVGFQLSFLAVMGIIYLTPIFNDWLKFIPKKLTTFKNILAMTLAAQIFTLPILVYNFGRISLVAPLTNILILPFLYWIMLFGFIFGLAGMFWQFLGWILSFPCWFLLTYLIKIVDFFSQSWAAKTIESVHWLWLIISYLILGFIVWHLNKREKLKFLNY